MDNNKIVKIQNLTSIFFKKKNNKVICEIKQQTKYVVDKLFSIIKISSKNNNKNKIFIFFSCTKIYIQEKKTATDIMAK